MLTSIRDAIRLTRDCAGILIPSGERVILPAGSLVVLKQSLGGDYTVRTDCGDIVRVNGEDADALGLVNAEVSPAASPDAPFHEDLVWKALEKVYDPEIPVSIVELGLVYDCETQPLADGGHRVHVTMTLTAPGCGMGEILKNDVQRKVASIPGVREVEVEIVFDPPWNQNRMSEAARLQLGLF